MPSSDPLAIVRYLDIAVVVLAAPFVVLTGAPLLGYLVGAAAWILSRLAGVAVERYARTRKDPRAVVGHQLRGAHGARVGSRNSDPGGRPGRQPGRRSDGGAARARRLHGLSGHRLIIRPLERNTPAMSKTQKIVFSSLGAYVLLVDPRRRSSSARREATRSSSRRTSSSSTPGSPSGRSTSTRPCCTCCIAGAPDRLDHGLRRAPDAAAPEPRPDRGRVPLQPDARQHHARQHGRPDGGEVVPVHRGASSCSSGTRT